MSHWFDSFKSVPEEVVVSQVDVKAEAQAGGSRRRKRRGGRKSKRRGGSRRRKHTRKH
jgi:hypothetical protein